MDWQPGGMSDDVEDRRSSSGGGGGFGGGGLGIIGFILLAVISLVTGRNYLGAFLHGGGGGTQSQQMGPQQQQRPRGATAPGEDRSAHLISFVLDDVQKEWTTILPEQTGKNYRHAKLVLFRNRTYSGCGTAQSATGPFYCPGDEKVYIDLSFWDELAHFGGGTSEFAQAYVVAHELGHHVQKILGTEAKVQHLSSQQPDQRNHLSVELELQADCFAGIWAKSGERRGFIHEADIAGGLKAAAAVGDDHLQKMERGTVSPETFTHGSSAQRIHWFKTGLEQGTVQACDTFSSGAMSQ
ncbi:KPN_02809 family neutral zinc metallopeptidase [Granulicella arctica]|uniref:KPN_02809 family neutral zinc metallopeptidase n=1 Tax=Granulicella arctica TaxID=940613 RepID=UPI0021DFFC05|nr:neutral zinc metallopeptidase [Granulicella arctica]